MLIIDPKSPMPPYEQLRSQLLAQISTGKLAPGAKLPSVRRLASDLGLAPNTVARTYRELEAGGFVKTAGRHGTIVAEPNDGPQEVSQATSAARRFANAMQALGLDCDGAIHYVRRAYAELETS